MTDSDKDQPTPDRSSHRPPRSFVRREGRLTEGQQRALTTLLPKYEFTPGQSPVALASLYSAPVTSTAIEVGFGNGDALLQMAAEHPGIGYLGIEVYRPGVGRLLNRVDSSNLTNVRVSTFDAVEIFEHQLAQQSIDHVLIFFPDPWPKKRHHKRRLLQDEFLTLVARVLKPGAQLHVATDWRPYAEEVLALLQSHEKFSNTQSDGGFSPRPPQRPLTKFEQRGIKLGHEVFDLVFRRKQKI